LIRGGERVINHSFFHAQRTGGCLGGRQNRGIGQNAHAVYDDDRSFSSSLCATLVAAKAKYRFGWD
jgi:hypothetical protein